MTMTDAQKRGWIEARYELWFDNETAKFFRRCKQCGEDVAAALAHAHDVHGEDVSGWLVEA
jgi:hypothetical protein